jgi:EF hand
MKTFILLLLFRTAKSKGIFLSKQRSRGELVSHGNSLEQLSSASSRRRIVGLVSSQKMLDKIFDGADTNHDGSVNFSEVYELVLKFYISINRQAPIPPPSKKRILQLFLNADTSHNNRLSREEFQGLANLLAGGAVARVTAHKLVTLFGAPLLAESLMRTFTGTGILPRVAHVLVPDRYKAKILPTITSHAFCRTVLVIVLVSTLGNVVLTFVNWVLNLRLGDEDKDERLNHIDKLIK